MTEANEEIHARSLIEIQRNPDPGSWGAELRAHVAGCESCAQTAEASRLLRERLAPLAAARAPESLVENLRRQSSGSRAPARRASAPRGMPPRWLAPLALAAGLLVGVLARPAIDGLWPGESGEVRRSVAEYMNDVTHDRYLFDRLGRPIEVAISDPAEASRWLSDGLQQQIEIPPTPVGWEMSGLRVWHTVGRLAALTVYDHPSGARIALTAVPLENMSFDDIPPTRTSEGDFYIAEGWGNRGVIWRDGVWAWSAVAPLSEEELLDWAVRLRAGSGAH